MNKRKEIRDGGRKDWSRQGKEQVHKREYNRFIGTGIKVSYEQRQRSASRYFSTDMSIGQMELLECLFPTDFHSVPPHYTEVNADTFPLGLVFKCLAC